MKTKSRQIDNQAIEFAPGLVEDETPFKLGQSGWVTSDGVRPFRKGMQTERGYEFFDTNALSGMCRGLFSWTDNDDFKNVAAGTHTHLYVHAGGGQYDITPSSGFTAGNADGFGGAGYGTGTYGSGTYGTASTGAFYPLTWSMGQYGQTLIANPRGQGIFQWTNDTGAVAAQLAPPSTNHQSDFTSYADQTAFDVDYTRGTGWTFVAGTDSADCDGTQTGDSDVTRTVTTVAGQIYRVTVTFTRTAGALSAIGATAEGDASSEASGTVTTQFIANSTSSAVGGRGDADFIGTVTDVLVELMGAPVEVSSILVTDRQIIAYGCSEEISGKYNPRCIRWCDFEDVTDWTTATDNNAGEYVIDNTGGIVRAVEVGSVIYVLTVDGVYVQQYLGQPGQTYFFDLVERGCGLIGPNAVAVAGQTMFWMSADGKFWMLPAGGAPIRLVAPIARNVADNLASGQGEKVYASTRKEFNEVRFYYPDERDGDGLENSRYVAYNFAEGKWSGGMRSRTAEIDQGATPFPVSTDTDSFIYYEEKGFSANGSSLSRSAKSGFFYVAEGGRVVSLRRIWPDFDDRQGIIKLKIYGRMSPGGAETMFGPYTVLPGATVIDLATEDGMPTSAMFALEWYSETAPAFWRLGKITMSGIIRGKGLR